MQLNKMEHEYSCRHMNKATKVLENTCHALHKQERGTN